MASWQVRTLAAFIRTAVRRDDWGAPQALARRARLFFGPPRVWQWFVSRGSHVERVSSPARGEWVGDESRDVILYMHGGGYVSCSPGTHRPITIALSRNTGARVFSVDYRLAPEHPFPAAIDDSLRAYQWLLETGRDPQRIALSGDSAGGGLVLALLIRARDAGLPLPACGVCFSPWADLEGAGAATHENAKNDSMFRPGNITQFSRAVLAGASPRNPWASPVFGDLSGLPPLLIQVGREELLLDDAQRVHDKIDAAGGSCTVKIVDGVFHGWQVCARLVPEADQSLADASAFISQKLALT